MHILIKCKTGEYSTYIADLQYAAILHLRCPVFFFPRFQMEIWWHWNKDRDKM